MAETPNPRLKVGTTYKSRKGKDMQDKENDFTIAWDQVTESAVKRVDEMSNDELDILADIFKDFK